MKTLLIKVALTSALLLPTMSFAQDLSDDDKKTPEERAKRRTEKMTAELGLDGQRADAIYPINLSYARTTAELKQQKLAKEQMQSRMTALKDKRDADLKLVLTAEQYTKMLALREQKKDEAEEKQKEKGTHNE